MEIGCEDQLSEMEDDDPAGAALKIEVSRLKKSRSAHKNALSGLIVKANTAVNNDDKDGVEAKLALIKTKAKVIEGLNERIQEKISEQDIEGDVEEATLFEETFVMEVLKLEKFIQQKKNIKATEDSKSKVSSSPDVKPKTSVTLPKIQIKKFTGDPTTWQGFKDIFDATIDKSDRLSDVEKFSYLKSHLGGAAEKCIEGIPLTKANYKAAMDFLEESI